MKLSKILLVILSVIFIGQLVYFYPQLPATIASHFNASGQANDWMSKSSFYAFEIILLIFFLAIGEDTKTNGVGQNLILTEIKFTGLYPAIVTRFILCMMDY